MHISSFCKLKNVIFNKESIPYFIKVVSYRPIRMFISTDVNAHIDRYARSHRSKEDTLVFCVGYFYAYRIALSTHRRVLLEQFYFYLL